jgi:hypothetical protein
MSQFDNDDLPPELGAVARQLRDSRYEASALELDQAKSRILKSVGGQRVARGGRMRKRSLLTAVIMVAAIATGSSGALAVSGISPFSRIFAARSVPARVALPAQNAALAQYGCPPGPRFFVCNLIVSHLQRIINRFPFLGPVLNRIINIIVSIFGGVPFPAIAF